VAYAYSDTQVARVIHAANAEMQAILGHDVISVPWFWEPLSVRRVTVNGVSQTRAHDLTAEENHNVWLRQKLAQGWVHGPEKDPERKTHPAMLPWDQLEPENRDQAELFTAVVRALSREEVS
jgi:hypothetical protein